MLESEVVFEVYIFLLSSMNERDQQRDDLDKKDEQKLSKRVQFCGGSIKSASLAVPGRSLLRSRRVEVDPLRRPARDTVQYVLAQYSTSTLCTGGGTCTGTWYMMYGSCRCDRCPHRPPRRG